MPQNLVIVGKSKQQMKVALNKSPTHQVNYHKSAQHRWQNAVSLDVSVVKMSSSLWFGVTDNWHKVSDRPKECRIVSTQELNTIHALTYYDGILPLAYRFYPARTHWIAGFLPLYVFPMDANTVQVWWLFSYGKQRPHPHTHIVTWY